MAIRLPGWIGRLRKWVEAASPKNGGDAVRLSATPELAELVATDGRRIAIVRAKQIAGAPASREQGISIAIDGLADAITAIGGSKPRKPPKGSPRPAAEDRPVSVEPGEPAAVSLASGGATVAVEARRRFYPDWRELERVIAADIVREAHTVNCDPQYLADLADVAKAAGAESIRLTLTQHAKRVEMVVAQFTTIDEVSVTLAIAGIGDAEAPRPNKPTAPRRRQK